MIKLRMKYFKLNSRHSHTFLFIYSHILRKFIYYIKFQELLENSIEKWCEPLSKIIYLALNKILIKILLILNK